MPFAGIDEKDITVLLKISQSSYMVINDSAGFQSSIVSIQCPYDQKNLIGGFVACR